MSMGIAFQRAQAADMAVGMGRVTKAVADELGAALQAERLKVKALQEELAKARGENAALKMGEAGLYAQMQTLKGELKRVDPNNSLFAFTGLKYQTGAAQTRLNTVYEVAFDAKAASLNLNVTGKDCRMVAK